MRGERSVGDGVRGERGVGGAAPAHTTTTTTPPPFSFHMESVGRADPGAKRCAASRCPLPPGGRLERQLSGWVGGEEKQRLLLKGRCPPALGAGCIARPVPPPDIPASPLQPFLDGEGEEGLGWLSGPFRPGSEDWVLGVGKSDRIPRDKGVE